MIDKFFPTLEDNSDFTQGINIKELVQDNEPEVGSKESKYGRFIGSKLYYKGKSYLIKHVGKDHVEVEITGKDLFGQWGDEFPLDLIR